MHAANLLVACIIILLEQRPTYLCIIMPKLLIVLLVIAGWCSSTLYAQKPEVKYYDVHKLLCNKAEARYVAVFVKTGELWTVTEMTTDSTVVMEGFVTAPENNKERLRNGQFVFYTDSGLKTCEGSYLAGARDGRWLFYYDRSNAVETEVEYSRGAMTRSRRYSEDDGKLLSEQYFTRGRDSSIAYAYYTEGPVKQTVLSITGIDSPIVQCFGLSGADTPCVALKVVTANEQLPEAPYDITAYLATHVHYPESVAKSRVEGTVMVRFIVNEDGSIADVQVAESLLPELDAEAVRIVLAMPPWQPGRQKGVPVKAAYTLPVIFKIP